MLVSDVQHSDSQIYVCVYIFFFRFFFFIGYYKQLHTIDYTYANITERFLEMDFWDQSFMYLKFL